jgi:hypothetical protein
MIDRTPAPPDLTGVIRGVGEEVGPGFESTPSPPPPPYVRRGRFPVPATDLRCFLRRKKTMTRDTRRRKASNEQMPMATFPWVVSPLMVGRGAGDVAVGWGRTTSSVDDDVAVWLGADCEVDIVPIDVHVAGLASVLHAKSADGGPGSEMPKNPLLGAISFDRGRWHGSTHFWHLFMIWSTFADVV